MQLVKREVMTGSAYILGSSILKVKNLKIRRKITVLMGKETAQRGVRELIRKKEK
jgi:hypothetical protein